MELFISLQDPRQRPRGTRDSLGFEQTWTSYGRNIVKGITTITNSLDNFIVALLGFYLSEENTNNNKDKEAFFIRFEQLTAYMRLEKNSKSTVLGITRAKKNIQEGNIVLSKSNLILSSQISYGLWGLYSSALADVGLIKNRVVTPKGLEIIDIINSNYKQLVEYIEKKSKNEDNIKPRYKDYIPMLDDMLKDITIRNKMVNVLLEKSSLYQYVLDNEILAGDGKLKYVKDFIEDILTKSSDGNLKNEIKDIKQIDKVMLVANKIFDAIRHSNYDGKNIDVFISNLSSIRFPELNLPVNTKKLRNKVELEKFVDHINSKQYKSAIESLLEINKKIMGERESIPWIEKRKDDSLKIRVKTHDVIEQDESFDGMSYNYFIYSYLSIAKELKTLK